MARISRQDRRQGRAAEPQSVRLLPAFHLR
jgi:hypothetical protein